MKNKKKKGFTLIELVIVIAIIGILAAIAIPRYKDSRKAAAISAHKSNVAMLKTAGMARINDMEVNEPDEYWPDNTIYKNYVEKWPILPQGLEKGTTYIVKINKSNGTVEVTPDENHFDNEPKK